MLCYETYLFTFLLVFMLLRKVPHQNVIRLSKETYTVIPSARRTLS